MAKRFGRNQKRRMLDQIERANSRAREAVNETWDTRRAMDDLRRRSIIVDVKAIESFRDREVELRTQIMTVGREQLWNSQMIREREVEIGKDRERFIRHVSDRVAYELADYIETKRWR